MDQILVKAITAMQVMKDFGSSIDAESLRAMLYADATLKEALRILPIIPLVPRVALKTFEVGGYTVPKVRLRICT